MFVPQKTPKHTPSAWVCLTLNSKLRLVHLRRKILILNPIKGYVLVIPFAPTPPSFNDPRWQHGFTVLSPEAVHWLGDNGVEVMSPASEGRLNFLARNTGGGRGITHMDGLDNCQVGVGKGRFTFIGFPPKLRDNTCSPIKTVALLNG